MAEDLSERGFGVVITRKCQRKVVVPWKNIRIPPEETDYSSKYFWTTVEGEKVEAQIVRAFASECDAKQYLSHKRIPRRNEKYLHSATDEASEQSDIEDLLEKVTQSVHKRPRASRIHEVLPRKSAKMGAYSHMMQELPVFAEKDAEKDAEKEMARESNSFITDMREHTAHISSSPNLSSGAAATDSRRENHASSSIERPPPCSSKEEDRFNGRFRKDKNQGAPEFARSPFKNITHLATTSPPKSPRRSTEFSNNTSLLAAETGSPVLRNITNFVTRSPPVIFRRRKDVQQARRNLLPSPLRPEYPHHNIRSISHHPPPETSCCFKRTVKCSDCSAMFEENKHLKQQVLELASQAYRLKEQLTAVTEKNLQLVSADNNIQLQLTEVLKNQIECAGFLRRIVSKVDATPHQIVERRSESSDDRTGQFHIGDGMFLSSAALLKIYMQGSIANPAGIVKGIAEAVYTLEELEFGVVAETSKTIQQGLKRVSPGKYLTCKEFYYGWCDSLKVGSKETMELKEKFPKLFQDKLRSCRKKLKRRKSSSSSGVEQCSTSTSHSSSIITQHSDSEGEEDCVVLGNTDREVSFSVGKDYTQQDSCAPPKRHRFNTANFFFNAKETSAAHSEVVEKCSDEDPFLFQDNPTSPPATQKSPSLLNRFHSRRQLIRFGEEQKKIIAARATNHQSPPVSPEKSPSESQRNRQALLFHKLLNTSIVSNLEMDFTFDDVPDPRDVDSPPSLQTLFGHKQ